MAEVDDDEPVHHAIKLERDAPTSRQRSTRQMTEEKLEGALSDVLTP
jgi:hypothetical protein